MPTKLNAASRVVAAPQDIDWDEHEILIAVERIEGFCKDIRAAVAKGRVDFAKQQFINIASVAKTQSR